MGLSINDSVYSCVFFFLTGLHFFHLLFGLLLLSLLFWSCSFPVHFFPFSLFILLSGTSRMRVDWKTGSRWVMNWTDDGFPLTLESVVGKGVRNRFISCLFLFDSLSFSLFPLVPYVIALSRRQFVSELLASRHLSFCSSRITARYLFHLTFMVYISGESNKQGEVH